MGGLVQRKAIMSNFSIHENEAKMQVIFDGLDECPRCGATLCDDMCVPCAKRKIRALEAAQQQRAADEVPKGNIFTLEYTDGYYIAKNGEGVIDLAEPENHEFAEFVVNALNAAQQSVQADACYCCRDGGCQEGCRCWQLLPEELRC